LSFLGHRLRILESRIRVLGRAAMVAIWLTDA